MRIYLQMQMNFCANRCQCQKCDANPDLFPSKQIALPTHSVGVGPTHIVLLHVMWWQQDNEMQLIFSRSALLTLNLNPNHFSSNTRKIAFSS